MINVAVIGVGSMGKNHVRVYKELEEVNLAAIADPNESLTQEMSTKFACRAYRDYRSMLQNEDIDAVSIAVPTALHRRIAIDCINAGKHVLVEKPLADTEQNARDILEAAEKAGVVLTVGHVERFNPGVIELKRLMESGKLGDVTSIAARRVGIYPPQIKDADVILDLAVHDIDILNYLIGARPTGVYTKSGHAFKSGREDYAIITLDYERASCVIQVNWITPVKIRELAVTGTKGYAELNYITQELRVFESNYEKSYDSFGDFIVKFGSPKEVPVDVVRKEPLKEELSHFIGCVLGKRSPAVTGEDALTALTISRYAIESYKSDSAIKIRYDA